MNYTLGQKLTHPKLGAVHVVEYFGVNVKNACPVGDGDGGFRSIDNAKGLHFVPQ